MIYQFPSYYHDFQCINKNCPDTCCGGWNISIDPTSLKRYHQILSASCCTPASDSKQFSRCTPFPDIKHPSKAFLRRFRKSIDFRHSAIRLSDRCCPLLTRDKLCGMYLHLGEDSMCKTCRTYPRHQEEFGELREISLSLSCPEAARIILSQKERPTFLTRHTSPKCPAGQQVEKDLLTWLIDVRKILLDFLWNPDCPLGISLSMALAFSHDLQNHYSRGRYNKDGHFCLETAQRDLKILAQTYLIDTESSDTTSAASPAEHFIRNLTSKKHRNPITPLPSPSDWLSSLLKTLSNLEPVVEIWPQLVTLCQHTAPTFLYHDASPYSASSLSPAASFCFSASPSSALLDSRILERQLLIYFIQIYFLGAIYDDNLFDKVQFAAISWLIIRIMAVSLAKQKGSLPPKSSLDSFWIQAAYLYSRQVENFDENLNTLFHMLHTDKNFRFIPFLSFLNQTMPET